MVQSLIERPAEGVPQAALPADQRERDGEVHGGQLDWDDFRELYYPDSWRHDLTAIVAYGSYKRSSHAARQPAREAMAAEEPSLDEWEDEGGALP
jgi:hypothetical protein